MERRRKKKEVGFVMQNDSRSRSQGRARFRCADFRGTGETNCHADCRFAKMKREGRNLNETETVP